MFGGEQDHIRELGVPFWSRCAQIGCQAVDAFLQDWGKLKRGTVCWAFPPVPLCASVVMKCRREGAHMVLILPVWGGRPHIPLLFDEKGFSVAEVTGFHLMYRGEVVRGKQGRPWFLEEEGIGRFPFIAIRFEGGNVERKCRPFCLGIYFSGRCQECRPL